MAKLKLSYFDVDGGRAEPIRIALHKGNIPFEDYRFPYAHFNEEIVKTLLLQVPVLDIDGVQITQSNAILRYVGKQSSLYPTDEYQALLCDEILDAVDNCIDILVATFPLSGDELKTAREALIEGKLTRYLTFLEQKLIQQGGDYFADKQLTIADLKVLALTAWLSKGALEHLPADIIATTTPKLTEHLQQISQSDTVKNYYASRTQ